MQIFLDFESDEPIYLQLKHQIIAGIAKKELKPGDRLPSVRAMAADIGINLHTVNKAYQQLKQEGFILIHRQKGVVVHPEGVPEADEAYRIKLEQSLSPLIAESVCRGIGEKEFQQLCSRLFKKFTDREGDNP
ncbi:GntR family transcriptional regulator [Thermoactinomyces sp. CICC 23799]|jgi:GntR family transcriptional regulator|uniref:GntR family transcriptional regulator n=1 Tax=Thermoactinomyces sp. CICC 23799 TaxID=2767429 RepID=UPI0018DB0C30|nr:GntR family transcriptional regulator [Thermoactinomyces sp. CICC 23799]MBH8601255.1 GntR family transcriptional regulator [Thermoactinomyces sp. CICC 23799]